MQSIDILQVENKKGDILHPKELLPKKISDPRDCLIILRVSAFKEGLAVSSRNVAKGSFTKQLVSPHIVGINLLTKFGENVHKTFNS